MAYNQSLKEFHADHTNLLVSTSHDWYKLWFTLLPSSWAGVTYCDEAQRTWNILILLTVLSIKPGNRFSNLKLFEIWQK